jgi:hypothetical protein
MPLPPESEVDLRFDGDSPYIAIGSVLPICHERLRPENGVPTLSRDQGLQTNPEENLGSFNVPSENRG